MESIDNIKQNMKNWSEEDWKYFFALFIMMEQTDSEKLTTDWLSFDSQIKTKSRYFPDSELLNKIKELKEEVRLTLSSGKFLYRARAFDDPFIGYYPNDKKELKDIFERNYPHLKSKSIKEFYYYRLNDELSIARTSLTSDLKTFFSKRRKYWGYNNKDSDAPPSEHATSGRANARHISYLYAASDIKTAISEIRPHVGQDISVATIRVDNDLSLFDFTTKVDITKNPILLDALSRLFSDPKNGKEDDYYATQYVSEYIRKLEFDGFKYKSSLNEEGFNVVLFDTSVNHKTGKKNYTILNSKVYSVTSVDVQYEQLAPYKERK